MARSKTSKETPEDPEVAVSSDIADGEDQPESEKSNGHTDGSDSSASDASDSETEDAEHVDLTDDTDPAIENNSEVEDGPYVETDPPVTEDPAANDPLVMDTGVEESQPEPAAVAPVTRTESSSGPGFVPLVLGGLVAGAIGFGAAYFQDQRAAEDVAAPAEFDASSLEASLSAQSTRLDEFEEALQSLPAPGGDGSGAMPFDSSALDAGQASLESGLADVVTEIDNLQSRLADLDLRLTEMENRPPEPLTADGAQAMAEQLSAFQAELDSVTSAARSEIEAAQARASEIETAAMAEASNAARRAALADIRAALESGAPYADALAEFENVPDGLAAAAESGVSTLSELRVTFPENARLALAETQVVPEDANAGDRLAAFLRRQTNARSLSPRDGDDVDSVLSRSEAALASGDLEAALEELSALPETAGTAMSAWRDTAQARVDAVNGAQELSAQANEN